MSHESAEPARSQKDSDTTDQDEIQKVLDQNGIHLDYYRLKKLGYPDMNSYITRNKLSEKQEEVLRECKKKIAYRRKLFNESLKSNGSKDPKSEVVQKISTNAKLPWSISQVRKINDCSDKSAPEKSTEKPKKISLRSNKKKIKLENASEAEIQQILQDFDIKETITDIMKMDIRSYKSFLSSKVYTSEQLSIIRRARLLISRRLANSRNRLRKALANVDEDFPAGIRRTPAQLQKILLKHKITDLTLDQISGMPSKEFKSFSEKLRKQKVYTNAQRSVISHVRIRIMSLLHKNSMYLKNETLENLMDRPGTSMVDPEDFKKTGSIVDVIEVEPIDKIIKENGIKIQNSSFGPPKMRPDSIELNKMVHILEEIGLSMEESLSKLLVNDPIVPENHQEVNPMPSTSTEIFDFPDPEPVFIIITDESLTMTPRMAEPLEALKQALSRSRSFVDPKELSQIDSMLSEKGLSMEDCLEKYLEASKKRPSSVGDLASNSKNGSSSSTAKIPNRKSKSLVVNLTPNSEEQPVSSNVESYDKTRVKIKRLSNGRKIFSKSSICYPEHSFTYQCLYQIRKQDQNEDAVEVYECATCIETSRSYKSQEAQKYVIDTLKTVQVTNGRIVEGDYDGLGHVCVPLELIRKRYKIDG